MPKRTYQPKSIKRHRKFGFRAKMKTLPGRKILSLRRHKKSSRISI